MPKTTDQINVDPSGVTMTVDIFDHFGTSVTAYTASGGGTAHTLPLQISSFTEFYLTGPDDYTVSCKVKGTEVAGARGTTASVTARNGVPVTVAPGVDDAETAALLGAATETYSSASSHQTYAADLELAAGAGKDVADGTSFLAAFMGNLLGGALTKTGNYLAGLIGHFSATSTASTYPAGGVLAGIGDGVSDTGVHGVVSYIDGDSETTIAGAAFKVMCNNSTAASGFHFGVDLQSAAHDGFQAVDKDFYLSAPVRLVEDVCELVGSGSPTDGTSGTGVAVAGPGSRYTDIAAGKLYINTNTKASPTWTVVGTQS